ncbi:MAG: DUF4382 domain-containing protein [Candidatus Aminicenantales bacterium]
MRSFFPKTKGFPLLAVLLIGLVGCWSSGDSGRLSLSLTDVSTDQYKAVYVTIAEIDVHADTDVADAWTTVATPNKTYNLLELANGVREDLALVDLTDGLYTQMRLIIGANPASGLNILNQAHPYANYVIDLSDATHELKVPSGLQTGIKLVQGFEINANSTTELTLDFDASRSVVVAGHSGKYLLKPTVQVIDTSLASIISGTVTQAGDQTPVAGALISAQVYIDETAPAIDQVVVQASTLTDENGHYELFVAANTQNQTYNVVASLEGFAPLVFNLTAEGGQTYTRDFPLVAAPDSGIVDVNVAGAGQDIYATVSFRQQVILNSAAVMIEVASINVLDGGPYPVVLPVGDYTVVFSTPDRPSQEMPVTVATDAHTAASVTF